MNNEWIEDWRREIGKTGNDTTCLNGQTSTTKNLDVALNYSKCHTDYFFESVNQTPVLFVFSILNWVGFEGFRMNQTRYTMYPEE